MLLLLCILLSFVSISEGVKVHASKIALATEGRATEVAEWYRMLSIMENKNHAVLFLLSYDNPIDPMICNNETVICLHKPGSTWTSGRNELARSITQFQDKHRHHFKYWLMGDQDMAKLDNCGEATHCQAPDYPARSIKLAACCFDIAMKTLLAPEVQYAIVNFNIWGGGQIVDWLGFSHMDCCDGSLNAFHHAAVPVVLPYIELIDKISWWEAQGLQFHVISGCFPGYSVYSNVFSIKATTAHSPYPMGRTPNEVNRALKQVYGKLGLIPDPISVAKVQLEQANCANLDHQKLGLVGSYEPKIVAEPEKEPLKTLWVSDAWRNMTSFKKCLDLLRPRYLKYMETGNLVELDGERF